MTTPTPPTGPGGEHHPPGQPGGPTGPPPGFGQPPWQARQDPGGPSGYQQAGPYQQGGYQQGGYFAAPGYPPPGPEPRRRTGLIVGIVVAALVLIGGGVTGFLLLTGDDTANGSAREAAESYVAAMNDKNLDAAAALTCDSLQQPGNSAGVPGRIDPGALGTLDVRAELVSVAENGDSATATIALTMSGRTTNLTVTLTRDDQGWQVCGFGVGGGSGMPGGGTGIEPTCGAGCAPNPSGVQGTDEPESAAREFADAFNARDTHRLREISCRSLADSFDDDSLTDDEQMTLEFVRVDRLGSEYEASYVLHDAPFGGSGDDGEASTGSEDRGLTMPVVRESGTWVICSEPS